MLIELRLRNYKCFRDEQVISMLATADKSHPENLIIKKEKTQKGFLKSLVFYGANASGKTKLLEAIHFIDTFVSTSAKSQPGEKIAVEPYAFDKDTKNLPSDFEISFIQNEVRYQYGFSATKERIVHEWLYSWPKQREVLLFERRYEEINNEEEYKFSDLLLGEKESIKNVTSPNALFLSVGATFNNKQLIEVYKWFRNGLKGFSDTEIPLDFVKEIAEDELIKDALLEIIKQADFHVSDFLFYKDQIQFPKDFPDAKKKLIIKLTGEDRETKVRFEHKLVDGSSVFLDFNDESEGTRRFFTFCALFLSALRHGGLIYVDEIDASLHTNLVKQIVKMIHDPKINCKNAQLIFNTHDTNLLNPEIFRRDQIWFVEKDNDGAASIYSLAEFSPRKNEAIEKGYLEGRYGAIPLLDDFSNLWKDSECQ